MYAVISDMELSESISRLGFPSNYLSWRVGKRKVVWLELGAFLHMNELP